MKYKKSLIFIGILLVLLLLLSITNATILSNNANITRVLPANHTFINGTVTFNVTFGSSRTNIVPDIANVTFVIFNTTSMIRLTTNTSINQSFYATSNNTALFGDGVYNITLQINNNSINISTNSIEANFTPAIHNLTIDNTAPRTIALNNVSEGLNTTATNITFNWTAIDLFSPTMRCDLRVDGALNTTDIESPNNTVTATSVTFAEGKHLWNITCRDAVNNTNTSETRTFTISTSLPRIFLIAPPDENISNSSQNVFNFTPISLAYTTLDACNLTLDTTNSTGGAVINNSATNIANGSAFSFYHSIPDGNHTWNVRCTDSASNVNFSSNRTLRVDTTAPTLNLQTKDPNGNVKSKFGFGDTVVIACNRSDGTVGVTQTELFMIKPGLSSFSAIINSSAESSGSFDFDFTETQEIGNYITKCEVKDKAGNLNRTVNTTFEIETKVIKSTSGFSIPGFSAPIGKIKVSSGVTSEIGVLPPAGVSRLLAKGATIVVALKKVDHKVTVLDVTKDKLTLRITSTPIEITINKGESALVDVDNDGINDLKVTFHKLFAKKWADLTLEAVSTRIIPPPTDKSKATPPPLQPDKRIFRLPGLPLLSTILVLLIIIVIAYFIIQGKFPIQRKKK